MMAVAKRIFSVVDLGIYDSVEFVSSARLCLDYSETAGLSF